MSSLNKPYPTSQDMTVEVINDPNLEFRYTHIGHYRVKISRHEYESLLKEEYRSVENWLLQLLYFVKMIYRVIYLGVKTGIVWSIALFIIALFVYDTPLLPSSPISSQSIAELLQNSLPIFLNIVFTATVFTTIYHMVFSKHNVIDHTDFFRMKVLDKIYSRVQTDISQKY